MRVLIDDLGARYSWPSVVRGLIVGFVVSESAEAVQIREATGVSRELKQKDLEGREKQDQSMMPDGLADTLTPEQLADLIAYMQSLK